jgi:hypothetical protein
MSQNFLRGARLYTMCGSISCCRGREHVSDHDAKDARYPKNPDSFQTRNQVMRKMLYISLGEVGSLDLEMTLPIQITIYFVWVVLTNVLLLNLLISMMGQTFSDNTQDTHNAWVFPVANFILRCETHILSRRWKQATRCGKRGSVAKVMRPSLCFMCPCSQSDCTLHCCLCARWWYF